MSEIQFSLSRVHQEALMTCFNGWILQVALLLQERLGTQLERCLVDSLATTDLLRKRHIMVQEALTYHCACGLNSLMYETLSSAPSSAVDHLAALRTNPISLRCFHLN
ncbi:hypothetical protein NE237_016338 [Protea cynaroides]|uniref:Uncharacterized protein n=1 Tax=Protea cynaroides TaxID=273540 RepID=A0A9Q0GLS7_9MAGN|nr:hypothetical protein NE237_016338 [Protea cynaroides]